MLQIFSRPWTALNAPLFLNLVAPTQRQVVTRQELSATDIATFPLDCASAKFYWEENNTNSSACIWKWLKFVWAGFCRNIKYRGSGEGFGRVPHSRLLTVNHLTVQTNVNICKFHMSALKANHIWTFDEIWFWAVLPLVSVAALPGPRLKVEVTTWKGRLTLSLHRFPQSHRQVLNELDLELVEHLPWLAPWLTLRALRALRGPGALLGIWLPRMLVWSPAWPAGGH
jgi:hypothetical protein